MAVLWMHGNAFNRWSESTRKWVPKECLLEWLKQISLERRRTMESSSGLRKFLGSISEDISRFHLLLLKLPVRL